MHGERDVLVNAGIAPPNALCVRVSAVVRLYAGKLAHLPLPFADLFEIDPRVLDMRSILLIHLPAAEMMRAGDNSKRRLPSPGVQHKKSNFRVNLEQVSSTNIAKLLRVYRVHPKRILVRDFVKVLRLPPSVCESGWADGRWAEVVHLRSLPSNARHVLGIENPRPVFPSKLRAPNDGYGCGSIPAARTQATSSRLTFLKTIRVCATGCYSHTRLTFDYHAHGFTIFLNDAVCFDARFGEIVGRDFGFSSSR